MSTWPTMSPSEASRNAVVFCWDLEEDRRSLMEHVLEWVESIRPKARAELVSATARQASAEEAAERIMDSLKSSAQDCMVIELIKGRGLVLSRASVLKSLGLSKLIELAHFEAIKRARDAGEHYSDEALDFYERQRHTERA